MLGIIGKSSFLLDPLVTYQERLREPLTKEERLALLLEASFAVYRNTPAIALEWAQEARSTAIELEDSHGLAKALFRIGCALLGQTHLEEARTAFLDSQTISRALSDRRQLAAAYQMEGATLAELGRLNEARDAYLRSLEIREALELIVPLINTLTGLAAVELKLGNYAGSLEHLFRALDLTSPNNDELRLSIILSNIAAVYTESGFYEKAQEYYERLLEKHKTTGDTSEILTTRYNLLRLRLLQWKTIERGELEEIRSVAETLGRLDIAAHCQLLIGKSLEAEGDAEEAVRSYTDALEIANTHGLQLLTAESLSSRGSVLSRLDRYAESREDLTRCRALAVEMNAWQLAREAASGLAAVARAEGNLAEALEHKDQEHAYLVAADRERQLQAVASLQPRIELEKAERERERLARQNAELLQEREEHNRQLAGLALHLVHKNEFLSDLRETLLHAEPPPAGSDELVRRINEHVRSDQDWQLFEEKLDSLRDAYMQTLSSRFPDLTATERKVCALMRIQLSSKAIANLLCVSVRTVENHRFNIRKKIGLSAEVNLSNFLSNL